MHLQNTVVIMRERGGPRGRQGVASRRGWRQGLPTRCQLLFDVLEADERDVHVAEGGDGADEVLNLAQELLRRADAFEEAGEAPEPLDAGVEEREQLASEARRGRRGERRRGRGRVGFRRRRRRWGRDRDGQERREGLEREGLLRATGA